MSDTTKSKVIWTAKKHEVAIETMKKRDKLWVEQALPHKATMRRPSLVASCNDKNKAVDDTVIAFTGAGIP